MSIVTRATIIEAEAIIAEEQTANEIVILNSGGISVPLDDNGNIAIEIPQTEPGVQSDIATFSITNATSSFGDAETLYNTKLVVIHNANDNAAVKVEDYVYFSNNTGVGSVHTLDIGDIADNETKTIYYYSYPPSSGIVLGYQTLFFDILYDVNE